ncbi:transposase IS116/IS110/IS902 family protein [Streptomyces sp. Ag82_O1-15]|uniref:IS110 family transposase n=1 Tax=Streptomyces sp. Ag82_O1-15 TaxID=1938855 RepID=UPI000BB13D09|nr:IS110 family transposase [Streptomyces sp. Ag82_O1-15]PBC93156.1 transposase IS116/IS110/IS902 family protein [Streptomyces sp. Ag82_O1-15]
MSRIWVGTDCGKSHHHCLVMDTDGDTLLSRRVPNDEPELLELIGDVLDIASGDQATWAMDMTGGEPALLIELLLNHGQELVYIPGIAVNRATDSYRGVGKTDARDAKVIADQARMRRDLQPIRPADEAAIELRLLTEHRSDLVADRTRTVNRLKSLLTGMFPALERAFDMGTTGALVLLTGYQTPVAIRRAGKRRLATWLRNRKVRTPDAVAAKALDAADRQHTAVAGEKAIARMVHTLAKEVMTLNEKIAETDQLIEGRFREHELAEVIASMPGIGPILGAEFLAAAGGSLDAFPTADRLATFAGVAPAPKDSGQISENHHRPRRYHRRLQRVFFQSAMVSIRWDPNSRRFYDRKRAEGKHHVQAVLALARRRVNVLWALIRDRRCYTVTPPVTHAA